MLKIDNQILEAQVSSAWSVAHVEIPHGFKCTVDCNLQILYVVKGYQECRFDIKDGDVFKEIGEKGRAFRIATLE